jgi:TonB family protein
MIFGCSVAIMAALAGAPPSLMEPPDITATPDAAPRSPAPPGLASAPPRLISGAITHDDYPAAAVREHAEGITRARLLIDQQGSVSKCSIAASSGHALLDETTCVLIRERFRFAPPRDGGGNATIATVTARVDWILDERPERTTAPVPPVPLPR